VFQRLGATFAVLSLSIFIASSASATYSNLYVFGDSLVDAGNTQALVLALTGGATDVTPASAGYFSGRFTNGITFADMVNQAVEGTNSVRSSAGGDNFAYGGARARTDADLVPDLGLQLTSFSGAHPTADPNALYLINIGGNDARDIMLGGLTGTARQAVIDAATLAISTSVASLQAAGATAIMVMGVGNVGATPEAISAGAAAQAAGSSASQDLNTAIHAALPTNVGFFDVYGLAGAVGLDPAAFGLPAGINLTNACLTSGTPNPAGPPTCTNYAFFDTVHPTSAVSQIIGTYLLTAVPEPGTASLVAIGLIAIGVRRRSVRH
jgi:phospholipase/lecithinase/hemolysin